MNLAGWCLACAGVAWSQTGFSSFEDVKQRVLSEADRLPNYTCTETMEQFRRLAHTQTFEMTERFRLSVAYLGSKEVYGWLGGEALAEEDLTRLIGGAVANGDFAELLHVLFHSETARISGGREEFRNGQRTLRHDYNVLVEQSSLRLSVANQRMITGYHGSFWVDPDLHLLELDAILDGVPRSFNL
jgi:hypothetical protein